MTLHIYLCRSIRQEEQNHRWKEHFEELLNCPAPYNPPHIGPGEVDLKIYLEPPSTEEIVGAINKWNTKGCHKRKCGNLCKGSGWTVSENMDNGGISSRMERLTHCRTPKERESPGTRKSLRNNPTVCARESV
ncbi:hypothetical protein ElyMa_005235400 [Elysia marginata]|uniref:Uncharacterized protein n=1 Tax=Elysia marginata TaxID=1093978 RepID=A0AAV4JXB1_9GAST|nr:hypothetical protein ElyMa_005235400 [Elysia marginata]